MEGDSETKEESSEQVRLCPCEYEEKVLGGCF